MSIHSVRLSARDWNTDMTRSVSRGAIPSICIHSLYPTVCYTRVSIGGAMPTLRMSVWPQGNRIDASSGQVQPGLRGLSQLSPIAASPDHLGWEFAHQRPHHVLFDDGVRPIAIHIYFPGEVSYMKPSIETALLLCGLHTLLHSKRFTQAIDVGAGTGFLAKYMAIQGISHVTAIDIDPGAVSYMRTEAVSMPQHVDILEKDALSYLQERSGVFDLIVSNPPYVPTLDEIFSADHSLPIDSPNFWKGTGLISFLLEKALPSLPLQGEIVLLLSSLSLKAKRVYQLLENLPSAYSATLLCMQEVAYKAWFAGDNEVSLLLADEHEEHSPTHFTGAGLDLFVGITPPGKPRMCLVNDGRRECPNYHWQVVYVITFAHREYKGETNKALPPPENTYV